LAVGVLFCCCHRQVGDSISCAVFDVEAGGVPVLTQRLPEEADDELAELAEEMDQVGQAGRSCGPGLVFPWSRLLFTSTPDSMQSALVRLLLVVTLRGFLE
jgi:hypothetical protein